MSNSDMKTKTTTLPTDTLAEAAPIDRVDESPNEAAHVDFDPYANAPAADGLSGWAAAVHVVRYAIGAGVLLMPYTMKRLGHLMGAAVVLAVGAVYFHTVHTLLATDRRLRTRLRTSRRFTYVELADRVFADSAPRVRAFRPSVRRLLYAFYALPTGNATYLIVMANCVQCLGRAFGVRQLDTTVAVTALVVPLTVVCMFRKILVILVPYASLANVCTLCMAVAVVVVASSTPRRGQSWSPPPSSASASSSPLPPSLPLSSSSPLSSTSSSPSPPPPPSVPDDVQPPFVDRLTYVPEAVAICAKAFRCTALVLPLRHSMRRPQTLTAAFGALNAAAVVVTAFYYAFGAIVYANYGERVRENVLLNLPADAYATYAISALYAVTLFVSYVLVFFARFDNVWEGALKRRYERRPTAAAAAEYGIRVGINALAYVMAVAVPNLALISAVAGTMGILLDVALPALLQTLYAFAYDGHVRGRVLLKDACIFAVFTSLFFTSAVGCAKQLWTLYSS